MESLAQPLPYVSIRQHQNGAWQPIYVGWRGTQRCPVSCTQNTREAQEAAVKFYGMRWGIPYVAPMPEATEARVTATVIAEVRATLQAPADFAAAVAEFDARQGKPLYVRPGTNWAAVEEDRIGD